MFDSMTSIARSKSAGVGFLSFAPDSRNIIYEMVYSKHNRISKAITVSSEKGSQEVPAAISRTCRQIRQETLPYFFDLSLIIFAIRSRSDFLACKEWLMFMPELAWAMVKGVRFKQTHFSAPSVLPCNLNFDLALERADNPVSYWGERRPECTRCNSTQGQSDCVPLIDLILKDMCAAGKITYVGVLLILDILEPLATD